jgi:hypothetical protein
MLPQLKAHADEIAAFKEMLIPFAARGNRNRTFVTALDQLNRQRREKDFLLLLADEESYRGNEAPVPVPRAAPSLFSPGGIPVRPTEILHPTSEFHPWMRLYASGLTARQGATIFRTIRETVDALNSEADSIFTRVDILPDNMLPSTVFMIRTPWGALFGMRSFTLELPLKQPEFK